MKIKIAELRDLVVQVLSSKYYTKEEAEKIAQVLLYAELTGKNTQGLLKLFGTEPAQDIKPQYIPKKVKETRFSALIDGGGSAGPLAAQIATDEVITKAQENGFSVVGTNNTFSSVGAIGYYARKIAQEGLIGIAGANSPKTMIHFGSLEPVYGTNPVAFGFPTLDSPIVFDMASSAITWYGLVRAKARGERLPDNVAIDRDGNITTNPEEAMRGAILPFDQSYKGSGIAMVVELLAGALTGASFVFEEGDWGTFFLAFSPDLLIGTDQFRKNASELIEKVKASKNRPQSEIHIPGYDADIQMQQKMRVGEIEIEEDQIRQMRQMINK